MANEEHLAILSQGVMAWNQWRQDNPELTPDLSGANLSDASLSGANLSRVDLSQVNLSQGELTWADLGEAKLNWANLSQADLSEASLSSASLNAANLSGANLNQVSLLFTNLSLASLHQANLRGAKLTLANLNGADFTQADLSYTDLSLTQGLAANFTGANFTGACIEDWTIDSATCLDHAICDYVYLMADELERCPREGVFAPGGFTKRFQQTVETLDLLFLNGINWAAFLFALQTLQDQLDQTALTVQALESRGERTLQLRLRLTSSLSDDPEKITLKQALLQQYDLALKNNTEQQYDRVLLDPEQQAHHRRQAADLMTILKQQAKMRPWDMETTTPTKAAVQGEIPSPPAAHEPTVSDSGNPLTAPEPCQLVVEQPQVPPSQTTSNVTVVWEDAIALLANIQTSIEAAPLPDDLKTAALDYLRAAQRESQKNKPNPERVRINLEGTIETLADADLPADADLNLWEQATPLLVTIAGW